MRIIPLGMWNICISISLSNWELEDHYFMNVCDSKYGHHFREYRGLMFPDPVL